jgi:hypothetical protein
MSWSSAAASPRSRSEDRALVLAVGDAWVVALADGTGGAVGGAAAAEHVVDGVRRAVEAGMALDEPAAWAERLAAIDAAIVVDPRAGETTAIGLAVVAGRITGASAGDSRAWLVDGAPRELTADQVRRPRLGSGRALPVTFSSPARGRLVVASDGLFDHVPIADILASTGDAAELIALVAARFRTLPDDVAVVVGTFDRG